MNKNEYSNGKLILWSLPVCATFLVCTAVLQPFRPTVQGSNVTVSVEEVPKQIEKINIEETLVPRAIAKCELELARQIEEEEWLGECELLAALVEAEAGNQDLKGKRLVADVVLNRVDSGLFPDTITEVIYQEYQFSTVLDGALDKAQFNISDESFEAVRIEAMESEERLDEDVLFFTYGDYNPHCVPGYKYQDHYFGY